MTQSQYADLVGMNEACGVLGVSRTTVWRLISSGQLVPFQRFGNAVAFKRVDVEQMRDRRAQIKADREAAS